MSLDWSVEDVENWEEIMGEDCSEKESVITSAIIWHTLSIPFHKITESNYVEFAAAIQLTEKVAGTSVKQPLGPGKGWEDVPITVQDVKRRIGLYTNAFSSPKNKQAFFKALFNRQLEEAQATARRLEREAGVQSK